MEPFRLHLKLNSGEKQFVFPKLRADGINCIGLPWEDASLTQLAGVLSRLGEMAPPVYEDVCFFYIENGRMQRCASPDGDLMAGFFQRVDAMDDLLCGNYPEDALTAQVKNHLKDHAELERIAACMDGLNRQQMRFCEVFGKQKLRFLAPKANEPLLSLTNHQYRFDGREEICLLNLHTGKREAYKDLPYAIRFYASVSLALAENQPEVFPQVLLASHFADKLSKADTVPVRSYFYRLAKNSMGRQK